MPPPPYCWREPPSSPSVPAVSNQLRRAQQFERALQLLAGGGQVLQKFHFPIEMNHEGLVLILAQHVVQKTVAGGALLVEDATLAPARVHQQAERQRQVGLPGEIGDRLEVPVFLQLEVILAQVGDDLAVLVAHGREHVDDLDLDADLAAVVGSARNRRAAATN